MKSKILLLLSFLSFYHLIYSQEFLLPLDVNPLLTGIAHHQHHRPMGDTLTLPFEDDFSRPGVYPNDSLWADSGVFINSTYSERPYTIGVATFDGLNQYGKPYHPGAQDDSIADVLTSLPIDLAIQSTDTSVWLSFFYQPQGLGDAPETEDSLILQFRGSDSLWRTVWSTPGRSDTAFKRVNIHITDPIYEYRGFQFRFYSIATVNGNRDQWNLDYVSLRQNTVENAAITDNALLRPQQTLLSEFTSMPYNHYKALGHAAMKADVKDTIYDIDYGPTSYYSKVSVFENDNLIWGDSAFSSSSGPNSLIPFSVPLDTFYFPDNGTDSADFLVKVYNNRNGSENPYNDTSYFHQEFYNYYSYDDGSVEKSYAITGSGTANVSLAYKFDIKITDTLRGVQIYFNPTGEDVSNKLFQLVVWSNIDVSNNLAIVQYKLFDQKPDTFLGLNSFRTYLFDAPVVVGPGPIWIGTIQDDPQVLLGIGVDVNTDSHSKIFRKVTNTWQTSNIRGSLMIRPLFGKEIPAVSTNDISVNKTNAQIFPNPANDLITIRINDNADMNYSCEIFDALGRSMLNEKIKNRSTLSIDNFSPGIYIVKITNERNHFASTHKLVVK